jgi:hypothetical protein
MLPKGLQDEKHRKQTVPSAEPLANGENRPGEPSPNGAIGSRTVSKRENRPAEPSPNAAIVSRAVSKRENQLAVTKR